MERTEHMITGAYMKNPAPAREAVPVGRELLLIDGRRVSAAFR